MPDDYPGQFLEAIGASDSSESIPSGGPASINTLLHQGNGGTTFLTDYNKGLVAFEASDTFQQQLNQSGQTPWSQRLSYGTESLDIPLDVHTPHGKPADWDPLTGGMSALGNNPDASQAVLKDPNVVKFLADKDWITDHGDVLGKAVESATVVYRNDGATGKTSAEIASTVVAMTNADELEDGNLSNTRDSMSRVFSSYMSDVDRLAASRANDEGVPGATNLLDSDFPNDGRWGATFEWQQLKDVLGATETDDGSFKRISAAGLAYETSRLDHAVKTGGSADSDIFKNAVTHDAAVMGLLMATGGVSQVEAGKEKDERTAEWLSLAQGAADMIPIPEGTPVEFAGGQGEDRLVDSLQSDEAGKARMAAQSTSDAMEGTLAMQTVRALYRNGAITVGGNDDPVASYDGGKSFASYTTDADGKTVIELSDPKDLSPQARQNMENWLNSSHSPYTSIKPDLLSIYNNEFPKDFG